MYYKNRSLFTMFPFGLSWGREDIFFTGWGDLPVPHIHGRTGTELYTAVGGMSFKKLSSVEVQFQCSTTNKEV